MQENRTQGEHCLNYLTIYELLTTMQKEPGVLDKPKLKYWSNVDPGNKPTLSVRRKLAKWEKPNPCSHTNPSTLYLESRQQTVRIMPFRQSNHKYNPDAMTHGRILVIRRIWFNKVNIRRKPVNTTERSCVRYLVIPITLPKGQSKNHHALSRVYQQVNLIITFIVAQ